MSVVLIGGCARSGKSRFAERLAHESKRPVVYIATMQPQDDELRRRVARHRRDRPSAWQTVEAPTDPAAALAAIDPAADNRGPVAFKQHVAGVMLRRAIARATECATERAAEQTV